MTDRGDQADLEPSETDVAIVGMSGRFAGAGDVDQLWANVVAGRDGLRDLARDELIAAGVPDNVVDDPNYVRRTGDLDDVAGFDHRFFGIGARDAAVMDPQHRHFLECCWEALESAAIVPDTFDGAIGVFGGSGINTYLLNNLITNGNVLEQMGWFLLRHTGNDKDFLTNNVAYRFDLHGPAINVQTACSTSLVAVHLAVQSLVDFESDVALAGGVTIEFPHRVGYEFREGEILSPNGRCRAFDAASDGTVLTSGVAVVALRRLVDAIEDDDPILAVIKGSAVNNDGSRKVGFLAPSVDAHAEVIREALAVAGLDAHDLQFFEGHGTGTSVGDPIEVAAATSAFRTFTDERNFCRLGSTKPNIGHTDTAAGAASLIKVVQALRHHTLPPLANHTAASPLLGIEQSPFTVSGTAASWPGDRPRRAGISSLGVGGTNAHVIVEEAPSAPVPEPSRPGQILTLSARSPEALRAMSVRLADHLAADPDIDLGRVANTLVVGRTQMPHRQVVTADDVPSAIAALRGDDRVFLARSEAPEARTRLALMFPGGGSQYPAMAAGLDERFATFHAVRREGIELVREAGGVDLSPLLGVDADPAGLLPPTASLPAVFVTSVALARQWIDFGATPDLFIGHSLGEYAAAHLAGVMSFADAVRLVVARSALMERASGDDAAMLVVPLSESKVRADLPAGLSLAVVNAADECVVAGRRGAIDALAARLDASGTPGSVIPLSAAAHSSLLDPVLDEFADQVRGVELRPPEIPYLSNLSGTWITADQATDPTYWVDHLRGTVRFADCLATATDGDPLVVAELGPGQTLSSLARRADPAPHAAIPSLRHPNQSVSDSAFALQAFARLWAAGVDVDLGPLTHCGGPRLRLPTYAFQHEQCWIEPGVLRSGTAAPPATQAAAAPGRLERIDDLDRASWVIGYADAGAPVPSALAGRWLLAGDDADPLIAAVQHELGRRGIDVELVATGTEATSSDVPLAGAIVVASEADGSFETSSTRWFTDATAIVKRLGASSSSTRFAAVTRDAIAVDGPAGRAADAMSLGVVRVAAREYPSIDTRLVDLGPDGGAVDDAGVVALVDELLGDGPQVVVHRDRRRLEPIVARATPSSGDGPTFRHGGTYLVTGGLGGVGHVFATYLAERYGANISVVSSVELPDCDERRDWSARHAYDEPTTRRLRHLDAIEQYGTKVAVVVGDLSDPVSVPRLLDDAERAVGPIDGVVHAAGLVRDALIELATTADHAAVLDAKAHGAVVLTDELVRREIGLMVLVSSTSTLVAPEGQASYVGANSVLDMLAGRHDGLRVATVDFGLWSGVGIASEMGRRSRLGLERGDAVDHPVFDTRHDLADGSVVLSGRVHARRTWVVDEHRTSDGTAVYPGSGQLHLMLTAAQLAGSERPALSNVSLLTPLIVPDDTPVTVRVVVSPDGAVEISSDGGGGSEWELHSTATIAAAETGDGADDGAIGRLVLIGHDFTDHDVLDGQRRHMRFGPRWSSLVGARRDGRAVLARLALDNATADEVERWNPHPALLDLATGAGVALAGDDDGESFYIPTGYGSVRALRPVPSELLVLAVESTSSTAARVRVDLTLADTDGRPVLEIDGLELLRARTPGMLERPSTDGRAHSTGTLTDLADELGLRSDEGIELTERLLASGDDRRIVSTIELDDLLARMNADVPAGGDGGADNTAGSVEEALTTMWAGLLGRNDIGPDEDFFDLGGHSLIAIRLMARIHAELGVRLELAAIFDAPTIGQLATELRSVRPDIDAEFADRSAGATVAVSPSNTTGSSRHLLPISTRGEGRPLYVVHGAGGSVLFLGSFGRALGDRPVFGFRAHGVNPGEEPDTEVDQMAARYVVELREHGPGPYLLAGYSGGGAVALEMCRLLQADGECVDGVVLFDSPVGRISLGRRVHARHLLRTLLTQGPGPVMPIVTSRLQESRVGKRLFYGGRSSVHELAHDENYQDMLDHGYNDLYDHFDELAQRFEPGTYDVDAILVKAQLRWPLMSPDYGWTPHIHGRLEIVTAPGDHESMFHAHNVGALVTNLAPLLERFDR